MIEGAPGVAWKGRTTRALFALLALHAGRPVSRERLAALIWSDSDDSAARGSLRMALLALRRTLGAAGLDLITATNETVTLGLDPLRTDVGVMQALAAAPDLASRRLAFEQHRGDLLEGLSLPAEAAELAAFLRDERERLRGVALDLGAELAGELERAGDEAAAGAVLRALLAIDPACETAHRAIIRAHLRRGDRAGALRQFETCTAALRDSYGVAPSAETQALREAIAPEAPEARPVAQASAAPWDIDEILRQLSIEAPALNRIWKRHPARVALAAALIVAGLGWLGALAVGRLGGGAPPGVWVALPAIDAELSGCAFPALERDIRHEIEQALLAMPGVVVVLPNRRADADAPSGGEHVLEAGLRCVGREFRVTLAAHRAGSPSAEWMGQYDSAGRTPRELRDELAAGIAEAFARSR